MPNIERGTTRRGFLKAGAALTGAEVISSLVPGIVRGQEGEAVQGAVALNIEAFALWGSNSAGQLPAIVLALT